MSIEYRNTADRDTMNLATALAQQDFPDTAIPDGMELADVAIDEDTGEVTAPASLEAPKEELEYPDILKEDAKDAVYA
jgi:hypothetical protein